MNLTIRRHPLLVLLLVLAGGLAVSIGLMQIYQLGVAHADTAAAVGSASTGSGSAVAATPDAPDPIAHPGDALSTAQKLYHSGAFFALGIVVAFCVLFILTKEVPWFQQGKRRVYIAAALGGLALLVGPATQGTTPNAQMLIAALTTVVALIINPKPMAASS